MKITQVEPIVLRTEVDVSRVDGTQDAFLVRLHTDEGIVGIGEADTSPYLAKTVIEMPSSHTIARGLREVLVGEDPLHVERLWRRMFHATEHYGRDGVALHVMSAIDLALWDILGKVLDRPVHELLGAQDPDPVRVYASELMPGSPGAARELAARAVEQGYTALKLGWGPLGASPRRDEALIRAARETLGPDRDLMIDGGRAYSVRGAAGLLRRVADCELFWLEEPLQPDDLEGYARLSALADTRIAAGEADAGVRPFAALARAGVDVLQPDLARCGGFTVARGLIELARTTGVDVVPHCFSTGILVAASLHLVAALHRPLLSEFSVTDSPLAARLVAEPFTLDPDGRLAVPRGPGLGVELDEEALERFRLETAVV